MPCPAWTYAATSGAWRSFFTARVGRLHFLPVLGSTSCTTCPGGPGSLCGSKGKFLFVRCILAQVINNYCILRFALLLQCKASVNGPRIKQLAFLLYNFLFIVMSMCWVVRIIKI